MLSDPFSVGDLLPSDDGDDVVDGVIHSGKPPQNFELLTAARINDLSQ